MARKKNIIEHQITVTLGPDEKRIFDKRKEAYKANSGKFRSNTDILIDILEENEELRQINKQKSIMIDLQFQENVSKLMEIKRFVAKESKKNGKQIKLDYSIIFKHTKKFNDLIDGMGDKKCT